MKPVKQTVASIGGNCFQACIASILELPLEECPHLFSSTTDPHEKWDFQKWSQLQDWSKDRNIRALCLDPDIENDKEHISELLRLKVLYIATGRSPRGDFGHCVVMSGTDMVHDPGDGAGIVGDPWLYIVFADL